MLRRRALTLLEVLIAIAIIAVMTAIVAPNLLGRVDERRFESAIDVVSQQLLLARAHAQATGETVEVFWTADQRSTHNGAVQQSHLRARLLRLEMPEDILDPDANSAMIERPEFGDAGDSSAPDDDVTTIYEPWARQPLSDGIELSDQQPQWLDDSAASSGAFVDDDLSESLDAGQEDRLRLAVFLPDGSALVSKRYWLIDEDERAAEIHINHWTGLPSITRLDPDDSAIVEDDEPDEPAEDEFDDITDPIEDPEPQPSSDANDDAMTNDESDARDPDDDDDSEES